MAIAAAAAPSEARQDSRPTMKLVAQIDSREHTLEFRCRSDSATEQSYCIDGVDGLADVEEVEPGVYSVLLGGSSFEVRIDDSRNPYHLAVNGRPLTVAVRDPRRRGSSGGTLSGAGPEQVTSPMPGRVVRVMVKVGDLVESGAGLLVVEAMKMQNEIKAPKAGTVIALGVKEGGSVGAGQVLAEVQ